MTRSAPEPTAIVTVEEATEVTDELVTAMERLVSQLSRSAPAPERTHLGEIVASEATVLLVARHSSGTVIGCLTLVLFRLPTGLRARIEDVVVDEASRGQGVGEALSREALRRAAAAGARSVDLTSRPSRVAANRLYQRLGFEPRETSVYRWSSPA